MNVLARQNREQLDIVNGNDDGQKRRKEISFEHDSSSFPSFLFVLYMSTRQDFSLH